MEAQELPVVRREFADREATRIPGRPWVLVAASLLLAALAMWTGAQYKRSAGRELRLRDELRQVYLEAENLRSVATQWRERAMLLEQEASALTIERDGLAKRLGRAEAELTTLRVRRVR